MSAPERLDRLFSRLAYCSRNEVALWLKQKRILVDGVAPRSAGDKADPQKVTFDGEPLEYPGGITLIYHKPLGSVCSHKESGRLIYDDFPDHWPARKPAISSVGRLDKETSGLLILTDDGALNHHLTSPKHHVAKVYRAVLARPLAGNEGEIFAAGTLLLEGEEKPLLPAELTVVNEREALLTLHEGRYHQARRMFAAVGNHVEELSRISIGKLQLEQTGLKAGEYRVVTPEELLALIEG